MAGVIANVSPTELIRSTWGNSVANELNNACVKSDGTRAMTGTLSIDAAPGIRLKRASTAPYIQYESSAGTVFGSISGAFTEFVYTAIGSSRHRFVAGGTSRFIVDTDGATITGNLDVSQTVTLSAQAQLLAGARFGGGSGSQIQLIDTSTSGSDFHDVSVAFYGAGVSMVSPGARTGFVGYGSSTSLQVHNEVSGGDIDLTVTGGGSIDLNSSTGGINLASTTGTISLAASGAGVVTFSAGGSERGRVSGNSFMWGKTTSGQATNGVELFESGTVYLTTPNNASPNLLLRHNTNEDAKAYVAFVNAGGSTIAEINQDTTAPTGVHITNCTVTAPSDYRLKDDLGPVATPLDRLCALRPRRYAWKAGGVEFDGFAAHEVADICPAAVHGDKDADTWQQLDATKLIPLLVAAVQQLAEAR